MGTPDDINVWIGLDIGKAEHFADVLDAAGSPLQAAAGIAEVDSAAVAQAWFLGMNPLLDDRSPLLLLSEGDLDEAESAVIGAARAFVAGG